MTTLTAFQPPPNNSFSFQPTLDGISCNAQVWWNSAGQRWFINVTLPDGTPFFNMPLIGSPSGVPLQALSWANGVAKVTTTVPHAYDFMSTVNLTIKGCSPEAYNGRFPCFITGPQTFEYKIAANPAGNINDQGVDTALKLGEVSYDFNIGGAFLSTSTLVYREDQQMFEVAP